MVTQAKRGFAAMPPERLQEIASMGGKAVPGNKRSFASNRELAQEAGRKGGQNCPPERRGFSVNPELAREAGLKGGASRARSRAAERAAAPADAAE